MNLNYKTVDEYIADRPKEVQLTLQKIREAIRKAAPQATEGIGYGMPAYKLHGVLVYFASYKTHIGFYPGAGGVEAFRKEIARYDTSKGTIQFPLDKPVPLGLISQIVKFRVKQNLEKEEMKKLAEKKKVVRR